MKGALAGYLPRIDLNGGGGQEWLDDLNTRPGGLASTTFTRHDAALTLSQMLFDGFAVRSEVARQRARVNSTAYSAAAVGEDVASRASDAYLDVMRRRETVGAAVENLSSHERLHNQIRLRSESGVGRRADLDQADARLALARLNLRTEESALRDAQIAYENLVGSPPGQQVTPSVPSDELPSTESDTLAKALLSSPSLKAADADVAIVEAQNAAAKAALSPQVDFQIGANHSHDIVQSRSDAVIIMLRLRYNLFRGGADEARIAETAFQVEEARETRNRVRLQVEQRTSLAFNALTTARDRLAHLERYAGSSLETRDAYAKQFSIGQRTLLDLLNAENEYFNARTSYITGRYLLLAAHFRVLAAIGILLDRLDISPPTEAVATTDRRAR